MGVSWLPTACCIRGECLLINDSLDLQVHSSVIASTLHIHVTSIQHFPQENTPRVMARNHRNKNGAINVLACRVFWLYYGRTKPILCPTKFVADFSFRQPIFQWRGNLEGRVGSCLPNYNNVWAANVPGILPTQKISQHTPCTIKNGTGT